MANSFLPKQTIEFDGALLEELQGNVSDKMALTLLQELGLSSMPSSSAIHDNGCGYGVVTMAVMAANHPPASSHPGPAEPPTWPVTVREHPDACALAFPDATFDLSAATSVFAGLPDAAAAAAHVRRTLKPGGTAVVAVWKDMLWHTAPCARAPRHAGGCGRAPRALPRRDLVPEGRAGPGRRGLGLEDAGRRDCVRRAGRVVGAGRRLTADEDRWEEAVDAVLEELRQRSWNKLEDGVHKIRMVADVAIMKKKQG
ncbi:Methyltransferase [Apiospora phragmitis]|uniref:Methyltransferase n=1 Tax=Apiospora phragmitis TaxID=2905665 RepID=A0ABR1TNR3_9PEZI